MAGGWAAVALLLVHASPVFAQRARQPRFELRPFVLIEGERFAASATFDAVFGSTMQPLWGGGVELTTRRSLFFDLAVSRLSKTGERAFVHDGQAFRLGIPLHATLTPVEFTAGYRFHLLDRRRRPRRLIPYVGAGAGWYLYRETSDFADGDDVGASHGGFVAVGGAEIRVSKWLGITADVQYTAVPGILGQGGLSKDLSERDLGGLAARVRVILGR